MRYIYINKIFFVITIWKVLIGAIITFLYNKLSFYYKRSIRHFESIVLILGMLTRRAFTITSRRCFRIFNYLCEDKTKDVPLNNPFQLKPIEYESLTLRKHDNAKRQRLYEFGLYVAACMPKYVQKIQMQHTDELEILIAPEGFHPVLTFMAHHQHACFNQCSLATAVDVPSREYRFEVVYNLLSLRYGERARVKTYTDELTPLHSAVSLWGNCNWLEREMYDMFGIIFTNHPDMRRILTDYGFQGHPLRKDFPLTGYIEVRYDDELKKIVYEPVEYAQEMRSYQLESPWNYLRNFDKYYNEPEPKKK